MYARIIKPAADISFAMLGIVIALPVFMFLMPTLWFVNGGSVFFLAQRSGLKGRPFKMLKFQTMMDENSGITSKQSRVTTLGRFLRRTSLDELPQLWNVLTRDMSIVGPRPLPVEYLPIFSRSELRRLDVLPGITGWAQVNGRHGIPWNEKFKMDSFYVDHVSFWLDMRIVLKTVIVLLSFKKDISLDEQPFKGN